MLALFNKRKVWRDGYDAGYAARGEEERRAHEHIRGSSMTFRIFSGWDSRQATAAEVFAHSVYANTSTDVHVQFVSTGAASGCDFARQGVTQFSYSRFLVPYLCGFEGVALFADGCDQLVLGDVAELAEIDMTDHAVRVVKHAFRGQDRPRVWSSVMLMDCAKLTAWTPKYVQRAADDTLMRLRSLRDDEIGDLPPGWNVLMGENTTFYTAHDRLLHWSYLSTPDGGSWIDRSGSTVWAEWRTRWLAAKMAAE